MGDERDESAADEPARRPPVIPRFAQQDPGEAPDDDRDAGRPSPATAWPARTGESWPPAPARPRSARAEPSGPDAEHEPAGDLGRLIAQFDDPSPRRGGSPDTPSPRPGIPRTEAPQTDAPQETPAPPPRSAIDTPAWTPPPVAAPPASEPPAQSRDATLTPSVPPASSAPTPMPTPASPPPETPAPAPAAAAPVPASAPPGERRRALQNEPRTPTGPSPAVPAPAAARGPDASAAPVAPVPAPRSAAAPAAAAPAAAAPAGAPGALRLTPTVVPDARTTIPEKIVFALAVLVAPLGLIASIVTAVVSARRRGWVPSLVSAGIVVGVVITSLGGGAMLIGDTYAAQAIAHRDQQALSQPMCRAIAENGLDATGRDFGWPPAGDSIDATVASIQAYADRWRSVQAVAPADVRAGAAAIATAATEISASIAQNRTISDADNTSRMEALRGQSPVPGWVLEYCS